MRLARLLLCVALVACSSSSASSSSSSSGSSGSPGDEDAGPDAADSGGADAAPAGTQDLASACASDAECASRHCFLGGTTGYCTAACTKKGQTDPTCQDLGALFSGKCSLQGLCQKQ